jgi:uncharacterized surface protein with fasciclin (FAS1) repeats
MVVTGNCCRSHLIDLEHLPLNYINAARKLIWLDNALESKRLLFGFERVCLELHTPRNMEAKFMSTETSSKTIVETAIANGSFNTLVAAVKAADLVATLSGAGPFTVLAPTDAAFAKLPAGTVETLVKPENKSKLAAILTYHVIAGKVPAATVVTLKEASTVEGSKITIEVKDGSVMLNGNVEVIITDVHCSNGIIHAIDTVLMPPSA